MLSPNYPNLSLRILTAILAVAGIYVFAHFGLKDVSSEKVIFHLTAIGVYFEAKYFLYVVIAVFGFLEVIIVTTLLGINRVVIDPSTETITFSKPFGVETVLLKDIEHYIPTIHANGWKSWNGLIIKAGNKQLQVAGQNLISVSTLKDYLDDKKIPSLPQKNMRFPFN